MNQTNAEASDFIRMYNESLFTEGNTPYIGTFKKKGNN